MADLKEQFKKIYTDKIKRKGADRLLEWLEKSTDFFTAPASAKYHCDHECGLVEHSLNVYKRLSMLCELESTEMALTDEEREKIAIVSLLHDLCKISFYIAGTRNVQNEQTKQWEKVPVYKYTNRASLGHGEESMFYVQQFIRMTKEEAYAIRYHMGAYEGEHKWNDVARAYEEYPLVLLLHMADLQATYIDEKK